MVFPPVSLFLGLSAIVFWLFAATLFVIRRGLCQSLATRAGLNWIRVVEVARWFFQTLFILAIVGSLVPIQIVIFFAVAMLFFQIQIAVTSRRRETESLGVLMTQVHHGGGSIPDLLEAYSRSNQTLTGAKARLTADGIRRGESVLAASGRMKLRLPTTVRLALSSPPGEIRNNTFTNTLGIEDPTLIAKLAMVTTYIPLLIFFMILVYLFLAIAILPTFKEMFQEFGMAGVGVELLESLSRWVLPLIVAFLVIGVLYTLFILFLWLIGLNGALRGLPVFGGLIRRSRQATLLHALAFSTSQERSLPDAFRDLKQATNFQSERRILDRCVSDIEHGGATSIALSRLLNRSQIAWVSAADENKHLSVTLATLAETSRMRLRRQIEWSVAVFLPLAILFCAIPVGLVCYAVMRTLTDLIMGLV